MPIVRAAEPADAGVCARVHVASWQITYRGVFPDEYLDDLSEQDRLPWWNERLAGERDPRWHILVVEDDEGVVRGFASAGPSEDEPERVAVLPQIYLEPTAWRQGMGRVLMNELTRRLRADGYGEAFLHVAPQNLRARQFYETVGWQHENVEHRESVWGVEVVTTTYRLRLR